MVVEPVPHPKPYPDQQAGSIQLQSPSPYACPIYKSMGPFAPHPTPSLPSHTDTGTPYLTPDDNPVVPSSAIAPVCESGGVYISATG